MAKDVAVIENKSDILLIFGQMLENNAEIIQKAWKLGDGEGSECIWMLREVAGDNPELEGMFETFYTHYPKKVGKDEAKRAWRKLRPTSKLLLTIIEDINKRIELGAWNTGMGKAFIPGPAPYLNQRKWLDEIIPRPDFKPKIDYSRIARETVLL